MIIIIQRANISGKGLAYRKLLPKRQKSLQAFQVPLLNLRLLKV